MESRYKIMALFKSEELPPKEIEEKQHPWAKTIKDIYSHRIKCAHNSIRNPKYSGKEKKQPPIDRVQFRVVGDRLTKEFIYCKNLVIGLYKHRSKTFHVPIIEGCTSIEWPDVWHALKVRFRHSGDIVNCLQSSVAVFVNGRILGGENELRQLVDSKYFYNLSLDYYKAGVTEFAKFIRNSGRPFAYMHVSIDETHIGTLIFMLYSDIVPYTCENFLRLCKEKKGGYGGTPVHRIVKDGWIQCGGFGLKNTPLSCENFIVSFDRRGVLAMANDGRDTDCSTQFFVLLQPAPWMNRKYVAFGQLIEGAATLEKIENVTTWYESPRSKIILYRCGILNMECQDIRINKGLNEYTDGHIEDLKMLGVFLWEQILDAVFLNTQLKEIEQLGEQYGEDGDSYKHFSINSGKLIEDPRRLYYLPLTDVSYPGDVDSDFDLKRLLKGDYCLECDLDLTAHKTAKKIMHPSLLFTWSASSTSTLSSDQISLNSTEKDELDHYLKNNVDRVSFAGGVVKNIAKCSTKYTDIFSAEHRRPSAFTDENLRKYKLAAMDLRSREERHPKVSIAVPSDDVLSKHKQIKRRQTGFVKAENLERIREFSKQHFGDFSDDDDDDKGVDNDDDEWSRSVEVRIDPAADTSQPPRQIQRRATTFIPSSAIYDEDDDDDKDNDNNDDDDDDIEPQKTRTPQFHLDTQVPNDTQVPKETPYKAMINRRLTGFIRPEDLPVDDDDTEDCDKKPESLSLKKSGPKFADEDVTSTPEIPRESLKKRRATTFVRASDIYEIHDDCENVGKESVLTKLYCKVDINNDQPGPTLKNFKTINELHQLEPHLTCDMTAIHYARSRESVISNRTKYHCHLETLKKPLEQIPSMQLGMKLGNTISNSMNTPSKLETRFAHSIRSMEYAKKRPTITVSEYKLINRQYQEALDRKTTSL